MRARPRRASGLPIPILGMLGGIFLLLPASTPAAPATAATQEIQIWHQMMYSHREVLRKAADRFESRNPGVKITLVYRETEDLRSAFQTAVLGGSGPALIHGPADQVGPFAAMNLLRPLDDLIPAAVRSEFHPAALTSRQGRLYALGDTAGNHLMLLYNRKILPQPPRTTRELLDYCERRKSEGRWCIAWNRNEPFFFVPWITGFGGEIFGADITKPGIHSKAVVQALRFASEFKKRSYSPAESDYEVANALFLEGKVPLIVNGEWAWGDYQKAGLDFGAAPLPVVSETGLAARALVGSRGYSVNRNVKAENLPTVRSLLLFLTGEEVQRLFLREVKQYPSLKTIGAAHDPEMARDGRLQAMVRSMQAGVPMPADPEIRAYWDATRPMVQTVLSGTEDPELAARKAQHETERQIRAMNEVVAPGTGRIVVFAAGFLILVLLVLKIRASLPKLLAEWRSPRRIAWIFMLPAAIGMLLVVVYPFLYNLVISVSNLSIRTFDSWQVVGFVHYWNVLTDPSFWSLLGKTVIWTSVNILFHMLLGVAFALLVNGTLPARPLFRALLILPWAVPSYITALVWRSMFNQEYGAVNDVLTKLLHLTPVEWLGRPVEAFTACIITNIWLGFPFIMVVTLGGLQSIPVSLYEAARIDGAGAWQRFRRITWPMLQPVLRPALILGAIWTFNSLHVLWLVTNGGEPADSSHILASQVYKSAFVLYRYGHGAALSMVNFALLLGLAALWLRSQRQEEESP